MTRWDSAAAPLFAVTAREGVWDYVTRAPPPACYTHSVQTLTHTLPSNTHQRHPHTN